MKKTILFLLALLLPIMVNAEEVSVKSLIPVDTKVSVKTEKFDYNNFVFNSNVDSKGNSLITFESIKNNTVSKLPISINILLFGEDQKNIGFLTYCTDKDLSSSYSGYKLIGGSSTSFSISVVSKYFVDGMSSKDVKYISVLDENKYCQIGGYDKYKDLTLDQIINGVGENNEDSGITKFINDIKEKNLGPIIIIVLVSIAGLIILFMVLTTIIKKIKDNKATKTVVDTKEMEPVEETLDLSYKDVDDDNTPYEDNSTISMGINNTSDDGNELDENDKENDTDLTSLFK